MAADLVQLSRAEPGLSWQLADVDSRTDWREQWGTEVPVLLGQQLDGSWQALCRHRLCEDRLLQWLGDAGSASQLTGADR